VPGEEFGVRTAILALLISVALLVAAAPDKPNRPISPVLQKLGPYIKRGMRKTGVPGVAVAVVYHDRVVYLEGFGIRKAGFQGEVNPDTVFQLASLSKPIASTIVAALVSDNEVNWDDRIVDLDPGFELSDPTVTQRVTIRDFLSHRSGLPTSSGDALEDLGFTRPEILHQMRLIPLAGPFRKSYHYSNFGYTEGAIAAAKAAHIDWEDLAEKRLFAPLEMNSSSYRYSDYVRRENKAAIHIIIDGKAVARYHRDPDAEAPAGAASSSVRDLSKWLRLQLADGRWEGQSVVDADALNETRRPEIQNGVNHETGKPTYYGMGWNVDRDAKGRLILSHSGAFFIGTGTTVKFSPSQHVGIIVLTNALPTGLAEATANTFFDLLNYGAPTQDWLSIYSDAFKKMIEQGNNETTDYSKLTPPSSPAPPKPLSAYTGTYCNDYYGRIEITEQQGGLWMRLPDNGALYYLSHWDADTFTYRFEAEQGIGARGVVFNLSGRPTVTIENLTVEGNGVFTRNN